MVAYRILPVVFFAVSVPAYAKGKAPPAAVHVAESEGGSSGNGGNAFVTPEGQAMFLDLVRLPSTVIYNHKHSEAMRLLVEQLAKHEGYSEATYFPGNSIDKTQAIGARIRDVLNERMQFQILRSGQPLPDPQDRGLVVMPWSVNGEVRRLALQDPKTGRVMVDGAVLEKMSDRDIAAFMMHEALIKLWYEDHYNITDAEKQKLKPPYLKSTDRIADIVNMTFVEDKFTKNLSAEAVSAKMCEAGIRVAPENVQGLDLMGEDGMRKFAVPDVFVAFVRSDCSVHKFKKNGTWKSYPVSLNSDVKFLNQINFIDVTHPHRCYDGAITQTGRGLSVANELDSDDPNAPSMQNPDNVLDWEYRIYVPGK